MHLYLTEAIMTLYNSDDGATLRSMLTTPNGMFDTEAPNGTKFPYITFSVISSPTDRTFCDNDDIPIVQFSCFGDTIKGQSSKSVLQIGTELLNLIRNTLLAEARGYTNWSSILLNTFKVKDPDKGWMVVYEMEYKLEKTR